MSEINSAILADEPPAGEFPPWPWLTILYQPRATIRTITGSSPKRYVILLAMLAGIADGGLINMSGYDVAPAALIAISFVGGAVLGLIGWALGGFLLTWVGSYVGGEASGPEVRAAMAWSAVPAIFRLLFLPALFLLAADAPATSSVWRTADSVQIAIGVANFLLVAWWYILFWKCYSEVLQVSTGKALLAIIVSFVVVFFLALVFGACAATLMVVTGGF